MLCFEIPKASNCERFRNEGTGLLHRSRLRMLTIGDTFTATRGQDSVDSTGNDY